MPAVTTNEQLTNIQVFSEIAEKSELLRKILPYYSERAREVLISPEMTFGKLSAIYPLLQGPGFSIEDLELIARMDERAIKGHIRALQRKTRNHALTVIEPPSFEQLRFQLYSYLRDCVVKNDGYSALKELQIAISKITDMDVLISALHLPIQKLAPIWEILHDIPYEQVVVLHLVDETFIGKFADSLATLTPQEIVTLSRKEMGISRSVRNGADNIVRRVKATIEEKIVEVEQMSSKQWAILRNSFNLRVHKHTLEAIIHYIHSNDSIRALESYSSSFYKSMTNLVKNGTLARILVHLKQKLPASFFEKSGLADDLREQLIAIPGGKNLLPKGY